jgi:hypothetical protein
LDLYRNQYRDFSVIHFFEKLTLEHKVQGASYNTVLRILKEHGLVMSGMMVHMDGSTHDWLGTGGNVDLVVSLDDAVSRVLAGRFTHQESTRSCMEVLKETVTKYGIFCSLYTDKAMHFVVTNAKGKANRFLNEEFIPWHNENLTVEPEDAESTAFVRAHSSQDLDLIFSVQVKRQVNSDNTIQFKNQVLQIPRHPVLKGSFAGTQVTLHEHLDGRWSITQGQHVLARFDRNFNLTQAGHLTGNQKRTSSLRNN